jgi:hypothetical protein
MPKKQRRSEARSRQFLHSQCHPGRAGASPKSITADFTIFIVDTRCPGRNAQQAVVEVGALLDQGRPEVVDADLADYFGSIPHAELLKSVARRIVDRRVL